MCYYARISFCPSRRPLQHFPQYPGQAQTGACAATQCCLKFEKRSESLGQRFGIHLQQCEWAWLLLYAASCVLALVALVLHLSTSASVSSPKFCSRGRRGSSEHVPPCPEANVFSLQLDTSMLGGHSGSSATAHHADMVLLIFLCRSYTSAILVLCGRYSSHMGSVRLIAENHSKIKNLAGRCSRPLQILCSSSNEHHHIRPHQQLR